MRRENYSRIRTWCTVLGARSWCLEALLHAPEASIGAQGERDETLVVAGRGRGRRKASSEPGCHVRGREGIEPTNQKMGPLESVGYYYIHFLGVFHALGADSDEAT